MLTNLQHNKLLRMQSVCFTNGVLQEKKVPEFWTSNAAYILTIKEHKNGQSVRQEKYRVAKRQGLGNLPEMTGFTAKTQRVSKKTRTAFRRAHREREAKSRRK